MSKPLTILLTEDDNGHAMLIARNLERNGIDFPMIRFTDGQETVEYLERTRLKEPERAFIMILDLNLPRMDGFEVLRRVKNEKAFENIPVIILSTTDNPREIERCQLAGCSSYFVKPVEYEEFKKTVSRLSEYISRMGNHFRINEETSC